MELQQLVSQQSASVEVEQAVVWVVAFDFEGFMLFDFGYVATLVDCQQTNPSFDFFDVQSW